MAGKLPAIRAVQGDCERVYLSPEASMETIFNDSFTANNTSLP